MDLERLLMFSLIKIRIRPNLILWNTGKKFEFCQVAEQQKKDERLIKECGEQELITVGTRGFIENGDILKKVCIFELRAVKSNEEDT